MYWFLYRVVKHKREQVYWLIGLLAKIGRTSLGEWRVCGRGKQRSMDGNLYSGGGNTLCEGETSRTSLPLYETLSKDEGVNYIYCDTESWARTIGNGRIRAAPIREWSCKFHNSISLTRNARSIGPHIRHAVDYHPVKFVLIKQNVVGVVVIPDIFLDLHFNVKWLALGPWNLVPTIQVWHWRNVVGFSVFFRSWGWNCHCWARNHETWNQANFKKCRYLPVNLKAWTLDFVILLFYILKLMVTYTMLSYNNVCGHSEALQKIEYSTGQKHVSVIKMVFVGTQLISVRGCKALTWWGSQTASVACRSAGLATS